MVIKPTLVYVTVKTQEQLDKLYWDIDRIIVIEFGTEEKPAIVSKPFTNLVYVTDEYYVGFVSGCKVYADDHAHLQVSRDSIVTLKDFASCEVYGRSFVYGGGNCRVILFTDEAMVYQGGRTRVYREGGIPDGLQ